MSARREPGNESRHQSYAEEPDGSDEQCDTQRGALYRTHQRLALALGLVSQLLDLQPAGVPLLRHAIILEPFLMTAKVVSDRGDQVLGPGNIGSRSLNGIERIDGTGHEWCSLTWRKAKTGFSPCLSGVCDSCSFPVETP